MGTDPWSYSWRRLCRSFKLKAAATALHSAPLCVEGKAKGGGIVWQVGRPGGEGGLQEVEGWGGGLPVEGSTEGTASATKEGEEEGWKC